MFILQEIFESDSGWKTVFKKGEIQNPQIVLAFGNRGVISDDSIYQQLKEKYNSADIVIGSTSGEISDTDVLDNTIVVTVLEFEHTQVRTCSVNIEDFDNSLTAAQNIVENLCDENLNHVFVIADGQLINGSQLAQGLNQFKHNQVAATGGLAGDGYDFATTCVGLNAIPSSGNIAAIGFYGDRLKIGFGSKGGWDSFGPERVITRSEGNVLYELDGKSALELYKGYLGEAAKDLPGSALYYPLSIKMEGAEQPIVRTILSVDEGDQSMTFAGDIPEGSIARLMRHNMDKLIDGAEEAAQISINRLEDMKEPDLAILVSCVGRKIVMGQNIEEEVEVIRELVGNNTAITGFYSYGEIAPFQYMSRCELHNQTMTITTFSET